MVILCARLLHLINKKEKSGKPAYSETKFFQLYTPLRGKIVTVFLKI